MALNDLGVLLARTGRQDEAIRAYEQAVTANSAIALPHNGLGVIYSKLEEMDKAVFHFEEAVRLDPNYAVARLNLAEVYRMVGREGDSAEQMEAYRRLENANPPD